MGGRIGVLITQWGEPEGFDPLYRRTVADRTRGEAAAYPGEPFTEGYVGEFPFRSSMGLLPHALAHPVAGMEGAYDSFGFFRLSDDGNDYVNVTDPAIRIPVSAVPPELVIAAKDSDVAPVRSIWAIDPRDGTDHLAGIVQIGAPGRGPGPNPKAFPTGLPNVIETSYVAGLSDMSILFDDLTPRLSEATVFINDRCRDVLEQLFGTEVEVRNGAYAASSLMRREDEVAADMVRAGLTRLVIARETTDNNNYANNFMSRDYVLRALARQGIADGVEVRQVRQVGRTPEYNTALLHLMRPHLERIGAGKRIAVLYCTYGLPWPGRTGGGPFSAEHPWAAEVYHENAYNNYVAFKRYAEAVFGERYLLEFNRPGRSGDARVDNLYSYGLALPPDLADPADPSLSFRTLRENIEEAKAAGHDEVLVVLSHWVDNNRDTLLAVRTMQGVPINERGDFAAGKFWVDWTEDGTHITYAEAFDKAAEIFALGYAHRLRGGVEMLGALPTGLGVRVDAEGWVDRVLGGSAVVLTGPLAGAAVRVPPKPDPTAPERFTPADYVTPDDPADNLVAAWDDFAPYLGTQQVPTARLAARARIVSEPLLVGPYRTIVNRPATVTLPLTRVDAAAVPFVYNEATRDFDPVLAVPGGAAARVDESAGTLTFETQVFGVFVAGVPTGPLWPELGPVPTVCAQCRCFASPTWACPNREA